MFSNSSLTKEDKDMIRGELGDGRNIESKITREKIRSFFIPFIQRVADRSEDKHTCSDKYCPLHGKDGLLSIMKSNDAIYREAEHSTFDSDARMRTFLDTEIRSMLMSEFYAAQKSSETEKAMSMAYAAIQKSKEPPKPNTEGGHPDVSGFALSLVKKYSDLLDAAKEMKWEHKFKKKDGSDKHFKIEIVLTEI